MKTHTPTTADIIRGRSAYSGMTTQQVRAKAGISTATWSRRMTKGDWTLGEIVMIDRIIHFDENDINILLKRK